jgi:hypothetical protein
LADHSGGVLALPAQRPFLLVRSGDACHRSGALTFIYENTLTLNGVTETFARTIDVTWGSPTYGGTEVIFHRVLMEFDLGADGVLAVEFPEEIYRSGSATIVGGLKIAVIPEPSTAMLVAGGLLALGLRRGSL